MQQFIPLSPHNKLPAPNKRLSDVELKEIQADPSADPEKLSMKYGVTSKYIKQIVETEKTNH